MKTKSADTVCFRWPLGGLLLLLALLLLSHQVMAREVVIEEKDTPAGYGSLSELVMLISDDAALRFAGFYTAAPVKVEPFPVLGEKPARRTSVLGATLADQMTAMINSVPGAEDRRAAASDQVLRGVLQEIDGYLRVHISGRNSRGQWRSYVANVEMSAAVYQAMHTYVAYERH